MDNPHLCTMCALQPCSQVKRVVPLREDVVRGTLSNARTRRKRITLVQSHKQGQVCHAPPAALPSMACVVGFLPVPTWSSRFGAVHLLHIANIRHRAVRLLLAMDCHLFCEEDASATICSKFRVFN